MNIKELREKSTAELKKLLLDNAEKRRELNFKIANKQLKNVREVRDVRKTIARILMTLKERKEAKK